jgi:hypothetical protein
MHILRRIQFELLEAMLTAEIIRRSVVSVRAHRGFRVYLHAANRVSYLCSRGVAATGMRVVPFLGVIVLAVVHGVPHGIEFMMGRV